MSVTAINRHSPSKLQCGFPTSEGSFIGETSDRPNIERDDVNSWQNDHGPRSFIPDFYGDGNKEKYAKSSDPGLSDLTNSGQDMYSTKPFHENHIERRQENRGKSRNSLKDCVQKMDKDAESENADTSQGNPETERNCCDGKKTLPWVPPPLPEHLRVFPAVAGQKYLPIKNQFHNDGSFMDIFHERMEALKALNQTDPGTSCAAMSTTQDPAEPFVIKRRSVKALKTGMVQKAQRKVEAVGPKKRSKGGWSRYMKEVEKYCANKCVDSVSCRPLMK